MAFPWAAVAAGSQAGTGIGVPIMNAFMNKSAARNANNANIRNFQLEDFSKKLQWERENAYSEKVWDMQNKYNEDAWHKMNAYNAPMQQMERFKEAGLNPNLIYGQQSSTPSIATAQFGKNSSAGSSTKNAVTPNYDLSGIPASIGGAMSTMLNARESGARVNNLEAQNELIKQDAVKRAVEIQGIGTQNEISAINRDNLKKFSADMLETQLNKERTETQVLLNRDQREAIQNSTNVAEAAERILSMQSKRITEAQERELRQFEINLRQMGINPSDPTWLRALTQFFQQMDILPKIKKSFTEKGGFFNFNDGQW